MNSTTTTPSVVKDKHFDSANIDNSMADLEVANALLEAAENFVDSLRAVFRPDGGLANKYVMKEINGTSIMISEAMVRIQSANDRINIALDEAIALNKTA